MTCTPVSGRPLRPVLLPFGPSVRCGIEGKARENANARGRSTSRLQPDCALTGPQDLRYVDPAGRHTASQNRASERPARAPDKPWLGAPAMGRSGSVTEAVSGLRRTKAPTLSELRLSVGCKPIDEQRCPP